HPRVDIAFFANHIFQNDSSGCNDTATFHHGMIHDPAAHPYQYQRVDGASVYDSLMSYGNKISNIRFGSFIRAMDDRSILDIDPVPDSNAVHISPHYRLKPHAAFIPHDNIAHDGCVLGQITIFSPLWGNTSQTFNECHLKSPLPVSKYILLFSADE